MQALDFLSALSSDFFTGVPDSLLNPLCVALQEQYGQDPRHHIIGANEGSCAALAAGYYLSTGKVPVIYLQNSGEGNLVNPLVSLLHPRVYGIPALLIIGWRGEPGVRDEPQHAFQGEVTLPLLDTLGIPHSILSPQSTPDEVRQALETFRPFLEKGQCAAFVIRRGTFQHTSSWSSPNTCSMMRESVLETLLDCCGNAHLVCTTGKASRELFEIRERRNQGHGMDFLTVGSMGHASSIALSLALQNPHLSICCIDGDGAALMHLGAMAVIGQSRPRNLRHILLNNGCHESVGGMPSAGFSVHWPDLALACSYRSAWSVSRAEDLAPAFRECFQTEGPCFLEVRCATGSRKDLGRPTTSPAENRDLFTRSLKS